MRTYTDIPNKLYSLIPGVTAHFRALSPGDKLIVRLLALCVAVTSIVGVYALERSFLVRVPSYGGTLTEGVVGSPRFVNPLLAFSDEDRDLARLTYAGLLGRGTGENTGTLVPVLAEEYRVSEDGKVYTFIIRDSAKFSDGTVVTAEDVLFTVKKAQDPTLKSPVLSNWAHVEVVAVDARTVQFTLPKPYALFLEDATLGILPAHIWRGVGNKEFPFAPYMSEPVGAGPFVVQEITRSNTGAITRYTLEANTRYVLGRPYLDSIDFRFFETKSDLQTALASGVVDSAYGIAGPGVLTSPYARVFGVFFNATEDPIYEDRAVRKALSVAIDRETLVSSLLGGYAHPSVGPIPYRKDLPMLPLPNSATRVADAQKILTDDEWKFSETDGVWKKGTLELRVTLNTSNVPELKMLAEAVQGDFQDIGVPVEIVLSDPNELATTVIRPRKFSALLFGEVIGNNPDLYAFWSTGERSNPGLNITNYSNKEVDTLLERVRTESDPVERTELLSKIQEEIANDYPAAFTHTPDFVYRVPTDVRGVELSSIASPSDRFNTVSSWYLQSELVWPFFAKKK
jgi:peptide/nickel transport system substrate-binding protein